MQINTDNSPTRDKYVSLVEKLQYVMVIVCYPTIVDKLIWKDAYVFTVSSVRSYAHDKSNAKKPFRMLDVFCIFLQLLVKQRLHFNADL